MKRATLRGGERTPLDAPAVAGIGQVNLNVTGPGFSTLKTYPLQTRLGWGPVTRTTRPVVSFFVALSVFSAVAVISSSFSVANGWRRQAHSRHRRSR